MRLEEINEEIKKAKEAAEEAWKATIESQRGITNRDVAYDLCLISLLKLDKERAAAWSLIRLLEQKIEKLQDDLDGARCGL